MLSYNPYSRKKRPRPTEPIQLKSIPGDSGVSLQNGPSTFSLQKKPRNVCGTVQIKGSVAQNNAMTSNPPPAPQQTRKAAIIMNPYKKKTAMSTASQKNSRSPPILPANLGISANKPTVQEPQHSTREYNAVTSSNVSSHCPPPAPQYTEKTALTMNPYKKKTTMSAASQTNSPATRVLRAAKTRAAKDISDNNPSDQEPQHSIQGPRPKAVLKDLTPVVQASPDGKYHNCMSQTITPMTNPYRKRNVTDISTLIEGSLPSLKTTVRSPFPGSKSNCIVGSAFESSEKGRKANKKTGIHVSSSGPVSLKSIRPAGWESSLQKKSDPMKQRCVPLKPIELPGEPGLPDEISFSIDDIKPIDDGYRKDLVRHANLTKPLHNGWVLFPHQKKAILQGLVRRRMILALDMGLGKTLIGCVWARSFKLTFDDLKVFVVCPVSLKTEWTRTAEDATGLKVEDEKGNGNHDSFDLRICSWAKVPTKAAKCAKRYIVVFDEAHSMQSMTSSRTKDSLKLVLDKRCIGVLLLTGTPMKNGKPSNLFPLLRAIRHPLGKNQIAYEKHFCNGMMKSFGRGRSIWDAKGSANLKQLKRLVSSNLLHLTKEQCLTLPPLTRHRYEVPISHRNELKYIQAVKNLASLQAASVEKAELGEAVLGAVQKLRCLCSFAKVGATVELAKKILEEEPSVVIFTSFAEVAKNIHGQLSSNGWEGELLTGETPQKKRQAMVDKFQAGTSSVIVCTFGAGGVGLTLTVACSIILLDRPWTPGDTRQAEDRIRRIGQTKKAKSFWMTGFELDKQIDDMIESKEEASKAVLAEGGVSVGPAAKINIPRLLNSLIAKVN